MGVKAFTIERTVCDDGSKLWRAELCDPFGRLTDSTRWTTSPVKAHRDGMALVHGHYWCGDDQPYPGLTTAA